MNLKKTTTGIILGTTAIVGATFGIDSKINPYENFSDRVEMITTSDLPNSGEQKVEIMKDKPQVRFKKWNGEVNLGLTYNDVKATGNRPLLSNKMEFKDVKQEVAAYPLNATSTEIEVILLEKPVSNIIKFTLDNYQNLDFFYQPALTQKEIDEGANRPENVVGSYAVFAKEKANHIVGQTNYGTGKVGHIYRPKIIDSAGTSVWGDLHIENGILSVTIPQNFLDKAVYPVRHAAGLTFGWSSNGGSYSLIQNTIRGFAETIPENGTGTSITGQLRWSTSGGNAKFALYKDSDLSQIAITSAFSVAANFDGTKTANFTANPSLISGTAYLILAWGDQFGSLYFDTGPGSNVGYSDSQTYGTWPTPLDAGSRSDKKYDIYATYTASEGGTAVPNNDVILFE